MNAARTASAIVSGTGLVTLAMAYFLLQSRLETIRKWKPVEAEVIRNWMEEKNSGSAEESTSYSAHYELAYTADGKPIRSTARSEDVLLVGPEMVQRRLERHSPGTQGMVYTNPDDPSQVRLNLGKNIHTLTLPIWLLWGGATLLLIGISLWFMGTPTAFW